MKTPQEIAAEVFPQGIITAGVDPFAETMLAQARIAIAIAAAREEGRKAGHNSTLEDAIVAVGSTPELSLSLAGKIAKKIRALASQPKPAKDPQRTADYMARMAPLETMSGFADTKPEPVVTCKGCKCGLPIEVRHIEKISNWVGKADLYTPCTAKPEDGKEL